MLFGHLGAAWISWTIKCLSFNFLKCQFSEWMLTSTPGSYRTGFFREEFMAPLSHHHLKIKSLADEVCTALSSLQCPCLLHLNSGWNSENAEFVFYMSGVDLLLLFFRELFTSTGGFPGVPEAAGEAPGLRQPPAGRDSLPARCDL